MERLVTRDRRTLQPSDEVQRLFLRHSAAVRGFIYTLLPINDYADDLLQEVFITAMEKAAEYQPGTNFQAWVCTIARFKVLEFRRAQARLRLLSPAAMEALADNAPSSTDHEQDAVGALRRCLEKLAPAARQVLELRYRDARTPTQIAEMRGNTPLSVNVALSRARAFLRRCMDQQLLQESPPRVAP